MPDRQKVRGDDASLAKPMETELMIDALVVS